MKAGVSTLLLLAISQAAHFPEVFASPQKKITESFHVKSDIRYRLATTQITSVIRNVAGRPQGIPFGAILPKEAFVVSFSMNIDGKVYNGEVKEKRADENPYENGLDEDSTSNVREAPRHTNVFEVSANVPQGSAVIFTLTYQEMLRRKFGVYQHEVHVNPGEAVKDFLIEVFIQETTPLKFVRTPALRKGSLITNKVEAENNLTVVNRTTAETAHITYRPSVADQGNDTTPTVFVVQYDVEHSLRGEVLIVDGYFVHFFSPETQTMPKDIIFVLDVSASMTGRRIQQMKDAMLAILSDLQPDDRFNIITFSTNAKPWEDQLVTATSAEIYRATEFVRSLEVQLWTNINDALLTGISELSAIEDNQRVDMIFFLTDGHATTGITDSAQITANVLSRNTKRSAIFCLAFSTGADFDLLTAICGQNSGFTRKIYEDSDAAMQVDKLYDEISAVSMKNITVTYLPGSVDEYTVTNRKFPVIFNGTEVIISGKMADKADFLQMEIKGFQKSGSLNLTMEVDDVNKLIIDTKENQNTFFTIPQNLSGLVEKMWGYMTIKQYLEEKETYASNEDKAEELKNKILPIALKYKFVTPLTSMVVTNPESPDKHMESGLEDTYDQLQNTPKYSQPQTTVASNSRKRSKGPGQIRGADPGLYYLNKLINPGLQPTTTTPAREPATSSGPTTKYISNTPTEFLLSAIIAETSDISICLAPQSVKKGKYNLIRSPNGSEMDIETTCPGKNCKELLVKSIIFKYNGSVTEISVSKNGEWMYHFGKFFPPMSKSGKTLTISVGDFEVTVKWVEKNGSRQYTLGIRVKAAKGYKGLIGQVLNMSADKVKKVQKTTVPAECHDAATVVSKYLRNKMTVLYLI